VPENWVINASPIIFLAKLNLIESVPRLCNRLVVPNPVAAEVCRVADAGAHWLRGTGQRFIQPAAEAPTFLNRSDIGAGERSVIAWALAYDGFIAVMDDHAARAEAQHLKLPLLGTVGVLLRLKKAGTIAALKPSLMQLRQVGAHVSESLFREALNRAGEQP
jgi:predicted nucleic acid-binding protein